MRSVWDVVIGLVFVNVLHGGINISAQVVGGVYVFKQNSREETDRSRPGRVWNDLQH